MPRNKNQINSLTKIIPVIAIAVIIMGSFFLMYQPTPNAFSSNGGGGTSTTTTTTTTTTIIINDDGEVWNGYSWTAPTTGMVNSDGEVWNGTDWVVFVPPEDDDDVDNSLFGGYSTLDFWATLIAEDGTETFMSIGADDPTVGSMFVRNNIHLGNIHVRPRLFLTSDIVETLSVTTIVSIVDIHYKYREPITNTWWGWYAVQDALADFPYSQAFMTNMVPNGNFDYDIRTIDALGLSLEDIKLIVWDSLDPWRVGKERDLMFRVVFNHSISITGVVDGKSINAEGIDESPYFVEWASYVKDNATELEEPWVPLDPVGGYDPKYVIVMTSVNGGYETPFMDVAPYIIGFGGILLIVGVVTNIISIPGMSKRKGSRSPKRNR